MRAVIAVNDSNLPVFVRHLMQSGYVFEDLGAPCEGARLLSVTTSNTLALEAVLRSAVAEVEQAGVTVQ